MHFGFRFEAIRVHTDVVTRPPWLDADGLAELWREQASSTVPVVDPRRLIELRKTSREKDYVVISELARLPLARAPAVVAARAEGTLPLAPPEEPGNHVAQ